MIEPLKEALNALRASILKCYVYASEVLTRYAPITKETASLVGLYLLIIGSVNWVINVFMFHQANALMVHWETGLRPDVPVYNIPFVVYVIGVLSILNALVLKWIFHYMPCFRAVIVRFINVALVPLLTLSVLLLFLLPMTFSRICFIGAALFFVLPKLPSILMGDDKKASDAPYAEHIEQDKPTFLRIKPSFFLCLAIIISLIIVARAWYPVQLPNDYFEIPDSLMIGASNTGVQEFANRSSIIDCMEDQDRNITAIKKGTITNGASLGDISELISEYYLQPRLNEQFSESELLKLLRIFVPPSKCSLDVSSQELAKLREAILKTGEWQVQPGRILYHHSYVLVPALHMLKYGILSPVPHLYGVGNTLFHTMLLKLTSPTLTGYFDTFPIAQLTGLLIVGLLIFYVTRNALAAILSIAVLLAFYCRLGFAATLLAPGFSLLRMSGLALQIGAIFFLFRGISPWRFIFMFVAFCISMFWNSEFAFIGLIGQFLALLSPQLKFSLWKRTLCITLLASLAIVSVLIIGFLERGYLRNIQMIIFGLLPVLSSSHFLLFCIATAFSASILSIAAAQFDGGERIARFCTLSIFALLIMKFLYVAAPVHFYYCLTFIGPVSLIYYKWLPRRQFSKREACFAAGIFFLCMINSVFYYYGARQFQNSFIEPFAKGKWGELGENFITVISPDPIVSRIKSIKRQIKADDSVLFLSPFDHLISIYINPEHYCGHFELVTNLLTYELVQSVVDCARTSPKALVVYDDASEIPCPKFPQSKYYDIKACGSKKLFEEHNGEILKALDRDLVLVKKEGPLSFYRRVIDVDGQTK